MKTHIIYQRTDPDLFKRLENAMKNGTNYENCYVMRYYEYTIAGQIIGTFTRREPEYEPLKSGI
jgi:hypothetical protein